MKPKRIIAVVIAATVTIVFSAVVTAGPVSVDNMYSAISGNVCIATASLARNLYESNVMLQRSELWQSAIYIWTAQTIT
jgi:hypothetical protein